MKLPRKISPDPIRDAIIEIRYDSKLPPEVLVGMLFSALDDTYTYADDRPSRKNPEPISFSGAMPQEIMFELRPRSMFYNEVIVVQMLPGSITFTCREEYLGWEVYLAQIKSVMQHFEAMNHIVHYTRVGMRYINDFAGIDLSQNTCFTYSFGLPDVHSHAYQFRAEFLQNSHRVILQLGKRALEAPAVAGSEGRVNSVMDIDVIRENIQISTFDDLVQVINEVHDKEKEVFYSVLKPEFLNSLLPEY